jgi:hypothetical protein
MNATEPVKNRFKTLSTALEEISRLESQVVALNAALASKTAAAAKAQTPAPAVVANQPPAVATPPAVKPINQMSSEELIDACDAAAAGGNHQEANRFYREYESRKANR